MRHRVLSVWSGLIVAIALTFVAGTIQAETDKREIQARESFASGRYQDALDIFVKLYAEKLHPNYLRNIGRCYQNLGDADKAISSFREYLRQSKTVRPDERQEVEGYIKEMEELKRQKAAAATATATPAAGDATGAGKTGATGQAVAKSDPSQGQSGPLPTATDPGAAKHGEPVLMQVNETNQGQDRTSPIYQRWWFWALIGGAVLGGVAVAAAAGAFTKTQDASCPTGVTCP